MRSRGSTSTRAMSSASGGFISTACGAIGNCLSAFGNGVGSFLNARKGRNN